MKSLKNTYIVSVVKGLEGWHLAANFWLSAAGSWHDSVGNYYGVRRLAPEWFRFTNTFLPSLLINEAPLFIERARRILPSYSLAPETVALGR